MYCADCTPNGKHQVVSIFRCTASREVRSKKYKIRWEIKVYDPIWWRSHEFETWQLQFVWIRCKECGAETLKRQQAGEVEIVVRCSRCQLIQSQRTVVRGHFVAVVDAEVGAITDAVLDGFEIEPVRRVIEKLESGIMDLGSGDERNGTIAEILVEETQTSSEEEAYDKDGKKISDPKGRRLLEQWCHTDSMEV
jgi:hypothetical protein